MIQNTNRRPRVVILGGGFAGIEVAKSLRLAPVDITLIDRNNYHLFQPLLYQVAMAGLSSTEIVYPIRSIFSKQKNVEVLLAQVSSIDLDNKVVKITDGEVGYDYLIIATGAQTSYFGHPEWAQVTLGLKDIDDALEIRRRVLLAFEAAEREPDPVKQKQLLTFVIIGGGPTGVELAGLLAELARKALPPDFRRIRTDEARIILLEGMPRILGALPEKCSTNATEQLRKLGVEVRTQTFVKDINADGVTVEGEFIPSSTVMWCAGVAATPLAKSLNIELDRAGRIPVEPNLSIKDHPEVFAVGDACVFLHQDGKPLPGLAPVAMQQGRAVAQYIRDSLAGKPRKQFHYKHMGSLATIGRGAAVADLNGFIMTGRPAWCLWLVAHIRPLIGFRNRMVVMFDWLINYMTYKRGARLITGRRVDAGPTRTESKDQP
ncbi:MAG: NAD(P)/FAD-dependent oxidoreductase [Candidatus Obscuribacterales bacterium]|nr:NAD(P)/FAD-dependent oxidoreductase [Candidatus Obscuribacterales bacterium]